MDAQSHLLLPVAAIVAIVLFVSFCFRCFFRYTNDDLRVQRLMAHREDADDLILYCVYDRAMQDVLEEASRQDRQSYFRDSEVIHHPHLYADMLVNDDNLKMAAKQGRDRSFSNWEEKLGENEINRRLRKLHDQEDNTIRRSVFDRALQERNKKPDGQVADLPRYNYNCMVIHKPLDFI